MPKILFYKNKLKKMVDRHNFLMEDRESINEKILFSIPSERSIDYSPGPHCRRLLL